MLGALLKAQEVVAKESLKEPLQHRFGRIAEKNLKSLERAFNETQIEE
jgi:pyruvate ferredoxin oxidoreductase gamma subunit